jgi:protein NRD1
MFHVLSLAKIRRSSEQELRNVFDRYGKVQTCIVNKDKRHAFVKMISRADAVAARDAMEKNKIPDSQLRVCSVI